MRIRHLFLACLVVLLVIPAFTAAWAQTSGDQRVSVSVLPADTLAIDVENDIWLDIAIPGRISNDYWFWMGVTNTFAAQGWQITVDALDLVGFYEDEPCDEWGCTRYDTTDVIAKTNLYLRGGDNPMWQDELGDPIFTSYEGYLPSGGMVLTTGTADARGNFGFDQNPSIRLDAPLGAALGNYDTTVTYTIAATP
jgi:hypothetical protein